MSGKNLSSSSGCLVNLICYKKITLDNRQHLHVLSVLVIDDPVCIFGLMPCLYQLLIVSGLYFWLRILFVLVLYGLGGCHVVVVNTFHARVRGCFPGFSGLKETKMFFPHPLVKLSILGSLRDREVACSASDLQGLHFKSCVCRAVSSHSSHHTQEVLLA